MAYLVGTDEAGFGPYYGPLVISATVWKVPDDAAADSLYRLLRKWVTPAPRPGAAGARVAIGDSKILYQPGKGLAELERGLLAALALIGIGPTTWRQAWDCLAGPSGAARQCEPWYAAYDRPLPCAVERVEVDRLASRLRGIEAVGVSLVAVRSRAVFPGEYNRLVERCGSKGRVLSELTLELAAAALADLPRGPICVVCDKHGGRNRYQPLLTERFPEWLVEVYSESEELSLYRFGPSDRRIEFRFQVRGEACLATALASMTSKYLRELAMQAWNAYWCERVEGLAPTAGYPQDARRFREAIAAVQAELGVADELVWRQR